MRKICVLLLLLATCVSVLAADDVPLQNWPVPARSSSSRGNVATNADASEPGVFIAVTPCRILDTRNAAGPFGGPSFSAAETRTYTVPAGPCTDIPRAAAYSMNFTIVSYNPSDPGFIASFAGGTTWPGVSTLNFGTGGPIANAAIVPAAGNGSISIYASHATHVIVDLNGYFMDVNETLTPNTSLSLLGNVANSGVIYGRNTTSTGGDFAAGVLGTATSSTVTNAAGVMGHVFGGTIWGVKGWKTNGGSNSGGVLGIAGPLRLDAVVVQASGVRGESSPGFGVIGVTNNAAGAAGVYADSAGTILRSGYLANNTYAVYAAGDFAATGTKAFVDPHPTEAGKVIRFVALEGPEAGTYFRGRGKFSRGKAVIEVPEAFRLTSEGEGLTVHVTPIGGLAMVGVIRQSLDRIDVEASRDVEFSYVVYGVRRGYRDFQPIADGEEFTPQHPGEKIPAYLSEEQKRRLIENGTYHADGTVNLETAVRLGWAKGWEREQKNR